VRDIKLSYRNSPATEFKKGDIPWNKGGSNPYSESTLIAMSEAKKGLHISRDTEFTKGFNPWNKDKKTGALSEEHKDNISNALKGKMPKNIKLLHSPESVKKALRRRIPTSLEDKFQGIINKHNLPYKYVGDGKFFIEKKNPDFINVNGEKIAIEVYARYYKLRNNKSIEQWKDDRQKVFNKYGWKIIFFNEIEVNEEYVLEKIK
jgi:very-short-patch-repair endonuclease